MKDKGAIVQKYIFALLTIIFLLLLKYLWDNEVRNSWFSVPIMSEKNVMTIESNMEYRETLLAEKDAVLLYDDYAIPFDESTSTYYLSQPVDEDVWEGVIDLNNRSLNICFAEDEYIWQREESISGNHRFTMLLFDQKCYQKISLVLTGTPVISMNHDREETPVYDEEDVDNYYYNSETRYYGDVTIFQAQTGLRKDYEILQFPVRYHERGATSAIYNKKNYAIKLLEEDGTGYKQPLFGMPESSEWKLINLYTDKSKVRDMTSLKLWKSIADVQDEYFASDFTEKGADMEYCELILDGVYMGLYGVIYPIDEKTMTLGENDRLYKILAAEAPSEGAMGYSIDNNYNVCYPIRMRYPEHWDDIEACWQPIKSYLQYAYWTPDAEKMSELVSLENLADFYIFTQVTSASDNQFKNTYQIARETEDGYTLYTIPWDLNYTFGDMYEFNADCFYTSWNGDTEVIYAEDTLRTIFEENINGAKDILQMRYQRYREGILSDGAICELMEQNMEYLLKTGAFQRESEKWPEIENNSDLSELEQYILDRMSSLDNFFLK